MLDATSLESEDLAAAANELLSLADAELKASLAERNRLQAEVAEALADHGRLLASVEHLEARLERTAASLDEGERTAGQPLPEKPPRCGRDSTPISLDC